MSRTTTANYFPCFVYSEELPLFLSLFQHLNITQSRFGRKKHNHHHFGGKKISELNSFLPDPVINCPILSWPPIEVKELITKLN